MTKTHIFRQRSFSNPNQDVLVMKLSRPQSYILQQHINDSFLKRLNMFNVEFQHIPNVQNNTLAIVHLKLDWPIIFFTKSKKNYFVKLGLRGKKCLSLKCLLNSTFWTFCKPSGIQGYSLAITHCLASTHVGLTDGRNQGSLTFPCAWAIFNAILHTKTKAKNTYLNSLQRLNEPSE